MFFYHDIENNRFYNIMYSLQIIIFIYYIFFTDFFYQMRLHFSFFIFFSISCLQTNLVVQNVQFVSIVGIQIGSKQKTTFTTHRLSNASFFQRAAQSCAFQMAEMCLSFPFSMASLDGQISTIQFQLRRFTLHHNVIYAQKRLAERGTSPNTEKLTLPPTAADLSRSAIAPDWG